MWAVGRLSLLSRGLHALRPLVAPDPRPALPSPPPGSQEEPSAPTPRAVVRTAPEVPVPVVAPPVEAPPAIEFKAPALPKLTAQVAGPVRHQVVHESAPSSLPTIAGVANPLPPPPVPPRLLQRIVIRIKRFFRSLFG